MAIGKDHFNLPERLFFKLARRFMSDKAYSRWSLRRAFGEGNPDEPRTLNEKLQWLKLYDRRPEYAQMVDKYAVREYVARKIGERYLNPLYQVCDSPEELEYDTFPDAFVLKATHGSAMNILVPSAAKLDRRAAARKMKKWLKSNYYWAGREWIYKHVQPRIVCEKFLMDANGNVPPDFKVFCFNGKPTYVSVDLGRFSTHSRVFYDVNWVRQPFGFRHPLPEYDLERPERLEEMLAASAALAETLPFARVDFYSMPDLVFGEITFFPANGTGMFHPQEWDRILGDMLVLPPAYRPQTAENK